MQYPYYGYCIHVQDPDRIAGLLWTRCWSGMCQSGSRISDPFGGLGKFGSLVKVGKLCGWFLLDFFFHFQRSGWCFFVLCFHFPVIKNEGTFYPVVNDRKIVFQLFFWMPEMWRKIGRFGTNHFWFGESWSLDIQGSITVSIKCHPFFGGIKQLKSALFGLVSCKWPLVVQNLVAFVASCGGRYDLTPPELPISCRRGGQGRWQGQERGSLGSFLDSLLSHAERDVYTVYM